MLRAMIPKKWLKEAKAVSVDQTAFPTFFKLSRLPHDKRTLSKKSSRRN